MSVTNHLGHRLPCHTVLNCDINLRCLRCSGAYRTGCGILTFAISFFVMSVSVCQRTC